MLYRVASVSHRSMLLLHMRIYVFTGMRGTESL